MLAVLKPGTLDGVFRQYPPPQKSRRVAREDATSAWRVRFPLGNEYHIRTSSNWRIVGLSGDLYFDAVSSYLECMSLLICR